MAVDNSEGNYPPPIPPARRSGEPAAKGGYNQDRDDDLALPELGEFDLDQVGALMALNIGLDSPPEPTPYMDEPDWVGLDGQPLDRDSRSTRHDLGLPPDPPTLEPPPPLQSPPPHPLPLEPPSMRPVDHQPPPPPVDPPLGHSSYPPADLPPAYPPVDQAVEQQPEYSPPPVGQPHDPGPGGAAVTHEPAFTRRHPAHHHPTPASPSPTPAAAGDGPAAMLVNTFSRSPWVVVGAAVAVLLLVAMVNWLVGSSGDQESQGGSEVLTTPADTDATDGSTGQPDTTAVDNLPPLSPAAIPPIDQPGLVGLELDLFDPYTGRGTTGSVELYLNAVSGQICHKFDADVMTTRYRAYIHEAIYPREGPSIVDLGETTGGVPQCVTASPIELARIMTQGDDFYVAAHSPDREVLLRGQVSAATAAFDNRDEDTIAEQAATANASQTTPTTEADPDALFGGAEEGAYLIVDAGRVTFEGPVPDDATAARLQAAFIPLAGLGVDVVDNLTIEAGAPAPSGRVVVADALLFGSGQDQIDGSPLVLTTLADLLRVNPAWTATITGHTDNVGEWLYNVDLSLRRANNIRASLAQLGVPPERIRVQGAGPEQPIADNDTQEGRARNRRIEISISSGG